MLHVHHHDHDIPVLAEVFTTLLPISSGVVAALFPQCLLPEQQPSQAGFPLPWQRAESFASPVICCSEPFLPRLNMSFHRRHGVLLLQCPQGCASPASMTETNYSKADTSGHLTELFSRGHIITSEGSSVPRKHSCMPAFLVHNQHRH